MSPKRINWHSYRTTRDQLAALFPAAIAKNGASWRVPLKTGVKDELLSVATGGPARDIYNFLAAYTSGPKYLRAVVAGGARKGLDGRVVGQVSPAEREHAQGRLAAHSGAVRKARGNRAVFLEIIRQQVAA